MITPEDYAFLGALLRGKSGLSLGTGKEYLLESRLPPVARSHGFESLDSLIAALRMRPHRELVKAVCDAMTTGETFFFRDNAPFDLMRTRILPEAAERCRRAGRTLRIWSAATSTGQEAYSIAMLLADLETMLSGIPVELLATDFATTALNRARRATYTKAEVHRGLPEPLRRRYFIDTPEGFKVVEDVRRRVLFRELNLLDSFRSLGTFDVIFCRNVLIYFDVLTKKDVLDRLASALSADGHLFLGSTESAFGLSDRLIRATDMPTSVHTRRDELPPTDRRVRSPARAVPAA